MSIKLIMENWRTFITEQAQIDEKKKKSKKKKSKKKSGLKNPEKADLDKNNELSGYELARGKAIEKAMASEQVEESDEKIDEETEEVDETNCSKREDVKTKKRVKKK